MPHMAHFLLGILCRTRHIYKQIPLQDSAKSCTSAPLLDTSIFTPMILPELDLYVTVTPEVPTRLRTGSVRCTRGDLLPVGFCNGHYRCPICAKPCSKGGHDEFWSPHRCPNGHQWQA